MANCLADKLGEQGIDGFVSNNGNLRCANIVINLSIRTSKRNGHCPFALRYTGNISLRLATYIQDHLWFKCLATADLYSTSRQEAYNLAKQGIIPLTVAFPNSPHDIDFYGDHYTSAIADAVRNFSTLILHGNGR